MPRVVVVTGGSGGIGRASAVALGGRGVDVVVGYAERAEAAAEVVGVLAAAGGRAVAVRADVADESAVAAVFDRAEEAFGGVDVVVHAAGRATFGVVADLDLDDLDALHRTNVRGTFVVAQQAARRLRRGGALVMVSTSMVGLALPGHGAYAASRGAVEALTPVLARELAGRDVTVNTVALGPTAAGLRSEGRSEEEIAGLAARSPAGRLGTAQEMAHVVAFLAGPEGRWVNGRVVRADGGLA